MAAVMRPLQIEKKEETSFLVREVAGTETCREFSLRRFDDTIGGFCGAVDWIRSGQRLRGLRGRRRGGQVGLDGLAGKSSRTALVAAEIADDGGGGTLVFVEGGGLEGSWQTLWRIGRR